MKLLLLVLLVFTGWPLELLTAPVEISGVVRSGDELLMVSDDVPGVVFRYPVAALTTDVIVLDPARIVRQPLPGCDLALDLEEVDVLADGRVVALSERLRCLVGAGGLIAQYSNVMSEFGNRGMEGLAVRADGAGGSMVAALWEGGAPLPQDLPQTISRRLPDPLPALPPLLMVHRIPAGGTVDWVNPLPVELAVPQIPGGTHYYRAPDLLWHRRGGGEPGEWDFIVLLSSAGFDPHLSGAEHGRYSCLQRFSLDGKAYGEPLELAKVLPAGVAVTNWEGMAWLQDGSSIVLVSDSKNPAQPLAVVRIPQDWE